MHRQGPPQYNRILESYAVALKPDMVIYGLYENDFFETLDFEAWLNSGEDWFTYHSGYWCGPASDIPVTVRLFRRYLKGCYSGYRSKDSVVEGAPAEAFLYDRISATGRYNSISLYRVEIAIRASPRSAFAP